MSKNKCRILYVDDEADLREIAAMSLELDPELEVKTVASGSEALEQAKRTGRIKAAGK